MHRKVKPVTIKTASNRCRFLILTVLILTYQFASAIEYPIQEFMCTCTVLLFGDDDQTRNACVWKIAARKIGEKKEEKGERENVWERERDSSSLSQ